MTKKKDIIISFKNIGKIKEVKISVKPLTIIIGPNNAGKTWLAYAISSLFDDELVMNLFNKHLETATMKSKITNWTTQLIKERKVTIDTIELFYGYNYSYFDQEYYRKYFSTFFTCEKRHFSNTIFNITFDRYTINQQLVNTEFEFHTPLFFHPGERKTRGRTVCILRKEAGRKEIEISISGEHNIPKNILKKYFRGLFNRNLLFIFQYLFEEVMFSNIIHFPPERTAFTYSEDIMAGIINISSAGKRNNFYPKPILNYLTMINYIKRVSSYYDKPIVKELEEIHSNLERELLKGRVKIKRKEIGDNIVYISNKKEFDIKNTSSLVKNLAIFDLYIRYYAQQNDLIIIDEPEMNLHPDAQIKLIELICMMVNCGCHFIITTHTPYMLDHLCNLLKENFNEKQVKISDYILQNSDALISSNQVGIYQITEKGQVKDIFNRKQQYFDLSTFSDVSDQIVNITYHK